jgi:lactate dehydrogenase-like 2-hydroxyacid dehydrogenase
LRDSEFDIIVNPEDAEPSRQWVLKHIANPDVHGICIMHPHKSDLVNEEFVNAASENLKVISTCSVGYGQCDKLLVSSLADAAEHINVKLARSKGIKIGNVAGTLDDSVADIVVMLVLMTMRRVEEGIQIIKNGEVCLEVSTLWSWSPGLTNSGLQCHGGLSSCADHPSVTRTPPSASSVSGESRKRLSSDSLHSRTNNIHLPSFTTRLELARTKRRSTPT